MNIKEQIQAVNAEKLAVTQKYKNLKAGFRSYITDKSIPVVERWEFFLNAPSELKDNKEYIWHPNSKYLKARVDRFSDIPEVYGRGKAIYVNEFFEEVVWEGKIWMENVYDKKISEDDIKNALEEILSQNLEYFHFDW